MSIDFRNAGLHDIQAIKDIAKRVIRANYTAFLGEKAVNDFIESGMSDKEIDDGIQSCTVITADGVIVGFGITNKDLLHLIMTDVPYQNKGYGSALLMCIENKLFEVYHEIRLQTFEENINAVQFYLKNGWVIADKQQLPEISKIMLSFTKANS